MSSAASATTALPFSVTLVIRERESCTPFASARRDDNAALRPDDAHLRLEDGNQVMI